MAQILHARTSKANIHSAHVAQAAAGCTVCGQPNPDTKSDSIPFQINYFYEKIYPILRF